MKKLMIFTCLVAISLTSVQGQSENIEKSQGKTQNPARAMKEKNSRISLKYFQGLLANRNWVIETHTVFSRHSRTFVMDPSTNFVSVRGDEITVQLGFNNLIGWNGVGGITLDGKIRKYRFDLAKKSVNLTITAYGSKLGLVDLFVTIGPNGNARANISGNWGHEITFVGDFVPFEESRIYKGMASF